MVSATSKIIYTVENALNQTSTVTKDITIKPVTTCPNLNNAVLKGPRTICEDAEFGASVANMNCNDTVDIRWRASNAHIVWQSGCSIRAFQFYLSAAVEAQITTSCGTSKTLTLNIPIGSNCP